MVGDTRYETSDLIFEHLVLGCIYERVDATAGEHQNRGKVIEPDEEGFVNLQQSKVLCGRKRTDYRVWLTRDFC